MTQFIPYPVLLSALYHKGTDLVATRSQNGTLEREKKKKKNCAPFSVCRSEPRSHVVLFSSECAFVRSDGVSTPRPKAYMAMPWWLRSHISYPSTVLCLFHSGDNDGGGGNGGRGRGSDMGRSHGLMDVIQFCFFHLLSSAQCLWRDDECDESTRMVLLDGSLER